MCRHSKRAVRWKHSWMKLVPQNQMACSRGKDCTMYHLNGISNGFHGSLHNRPPSWRKQLPLLWVISHFPNPNQTDASCVHRVLCKKETTTKKTKQKPSALELHPHNWDHAKCYYPSQPRVLIKICQGWARKITINTWTEWKRLFFYWSMSSQLSVGTLQGRVCVFQGNGEGPFDVDMAWRGHESVKRFKTPVKYDLLKSSADASPSALILHYYQLPSWEFLITFFCFIYLIYNPSANLFHVQQHIE